MVNGALGRIRTCDLCLRRATLYPLSYERVQTMVPKVRLELTRGYPHYALNVARLPIPPLRHVTGMPDRWLFREGSLVGGTGLEPVTSCV